MKMPDQWHAAFVAVGSNLGDPLVNCRNGIAALGAHADVDLTAQSNFYRTEPVDYTDQSWFANAVVKIATRLDPLCLLKVLQGIEKDAGRIANAVRFGPRVLDLDVVLYDDVVMQTDELVIPHPRMHKRRFVLKPICDIDPRIIHPVFRLSMQMLFDKLEATGQRIFPYSCDC